MGLFPIRRPKSKPPTSTLAEIMARERLRTRVKEAREAIAAAKSAGLSYSEIVRRIGCTADELTEIVKNRTHCTAILLGDFQLIAAQAERENPRR